MEHKIVKTRYNTTSFPNYRYEAECSCGFATKMPNKEAAVSQIVAHLQGKGVNTDDYLKVDVRTIKDKTIPQHEYTFPFEFEEFPARQVPEQAADKIVGQNETNVDQGGTTTTPSVGGNTPVDNKDTTPPNTPNNASPDSGATTEGQENEQKGFNPLGGGLRKVG